MNVTGPYRWWVNIDLSEGFVPLGNKLLTEQMLTRTYGAVWRHKALSS